MGFISEQIVKSYKDVLFRRHDPDGSMFYFDYSNFEGLVKQEYSFVTRKGNKLHGGFYCYDDPIPGKLIVFDHGLSNGHRSYMREIETLCRHGYFVFAFDHTGSDTSEAYFDAMQSLDAVEASLCEEIVEQLCEDIFNATVARW